MGISRIATAQPVATDPCKALRHDLTVAAMNVTDVQERGRLLTAMPECRPLADGTTEVVEHVVALPEHVAFDPHVVLVPTLGLGTWSFSGSEADPTRVAPVLEVAVGVRFHRSLTLAAFLAESGIPTAGVNAQINPAPYPRSS